MDGYILPKLKLVTVEPVLFLYTLVIFLESHALQELIVVKSCIMLDHPPNITDCSYDLKQNMTDAVTQEAANWLKYNSLCLFFFTFITSFYVGSWSDRFGRKLPMIVPPIGTVIAATVNAILSYFFEVHVAYFLITAFISGITFGLVGVIASTYGYISDFTHEQSRTKRIVILEAMLFAGAMVGTYVSGAFLKHVRYDAVLNNFVQLFMFEAFVSAIIVFYIVVRIPSTGSPTLQGTISFSGLFSLRHVMDSLRTVLRFREDGKRKKVILMLVALFFIYFGEVVESSLGYYFVKEQLNWAFEKYVNFHSIQLGVKGFALLVLLPFLFHFCRVSDYFLNILGIISRITGHIVFGLSINDNMIYGCAALFVFSEFPVPILRSMLSKTVAADEKGKIFAFTTILLNFCYLLGSFVLMTIFNHFAFHGLCFVVVAVMQAFALLIIVYLYFTRTTYITMYETIEHEDGSVSEICNVVEASDSIN